MILSNERARAVLDPQCGGRLASLQIGGEEVLVTQRGSDTQWGCYPMVPWAGRVRSGRFEWNAQAQQLPINLPPHALHGTVFAAQWEVTGDTTMRCQLGPSWPWPAEVQSIFELHESELVWRLQVHADDAAFPVVLGWHPWFRRTLRGGGPVQLSFEPQQMYVRDEVGIPTGEQVPPTVGPWDDCFTQLKSTPRLTWPSGLSIELHSSCTHWVVYDEPDHAVCVEPQSGPPDAFNLGGYEVARPGQPVCHTMRMRWSSREDALR